MSGKTRLSLTLSKEIVKKVDNLVDGVKTRNRSHAVELLLSKALSMNNPKKAIILAGGKGTRLRPITYEIPKGMIPIRGRPILEHIISLLRKYDVREIIISIGYLGEKIEEYFGDGSKFGVNIKYVREKKPLGTGGGLNLAKQFIDDTFILINGDILMDIDISDLYSYHKEHKALATVSLTTVDDTASFGVVEMKGSQIIKFVEKPKKKESSSNLVNAGFYILEPEVFDLVPEGFSAIEKHVFPKITEKGKLFGYAFSGQWFSINNKEEYENAIKEWKGI